LEQDPIAAASLEARVAVVSVELQERLSVNTGEPPPLEKTKMLNNPVPT
jgi:hypothetical protein